MKNNPNLFLYSLQGVILILLAWIVFELFSNPVNAQEQILYKEIAHTQYNAKDILTQTSRFTYRMYNDILRRRPIDNKPILSALDSINYFCVQTLDSIQTIFKINSLSFEKMTLLISHCRENLNQRIYDALLVFGEQMHFVEDEEIEEFYSQFPSSTRKTFNQKNQALLKSLTLSEIEQIRRICTSFLAYRISFNGLIFREQIILQKDRSKPINKPTLNIFLTPEKSDLYHLLSCKINGKPININSDFAIYETTFRDTTTQTLIVETEVNIRYSDSIIPVRDTIILHPSK